METRKERIERLKNNKEAFYFLSDEDKELLEEMKEINQLVYVERDGIFHKRKGSGSLFNCSNYRIHKDYEEPEDKFVVCKVNKKLLPFFALSNWLIGFGLGSIIPAILYHAPAAACFSAMTFVVGVAVFRDCIMSTKEK